LAQSDKSCTGVPATKQAQIEKSMKSQRRYWCKMTEMTSEDRDDLDDTIEDEIEVDEFARAAAREASRFHAPLR
jgi:hypothetical protein